MTSQHMGPAAPGKRLYFEEVDKPKPPSKLSHAVQQAPGLMVSGAVHREVQRAEQDNVGLESWSWAQKRQGVLRRAPITPTS